jgi:hypothetical protein
LAFNSPAETIRAHVRSIVTLAVEHSASGRSLLLVDRHSPLASLLADAYADVLPGAASLDATGSPPDDVFRAIDHLSAGDLVVVIESTRFPLAGHRFRIDLFDRGLKVIEHPHLARIRDSEIPVYIDALAYDPEYYRTVGPALKRKIDAAARIRVIGGGTSLVYDSLFEDAKLNIGDYRGQKNVGGQFPIGEVFTEPRDLSGVNGEIPLFGFGDSDFRLAVPDRPLRIRIEKGILIETSAAPPEFLAVLDAIRAEEQCVRIRELGFGLNPALTRERRVTDVGSYERMCGIHLSLGSKHAIYAKPGFSKRKTKFHVDVFAAVDSVDIDAETVFSNGSYLEPTGS